jgi:hypothetical protein
MSLNIGLVIIVSIVILIVVMFFKMKSMAIKTTSAIAPDDKVKDAIEEFVEEIISDYYNEYRINYLAVRHNIKELESNTSYAFKTKKIGSLINILDIKQVSYGVKYIGELILKKYNVVIPVDKHLSFIIDISRIEGKIKAVESVKALLPIEDYKKLISELEEDIIYYIKKYTNTV